jgi:outer membrane immunogenic protein
MKKLTIVIAVTALIGTPAFAADMAVKAPPPPPAPIYSWTGFYIGGNAGYGWGGNQTVSFTSNGGPVSILSNDLASFIGPGLPVSFSVSGAVGGFQLGYNWQVSQTWLLGLETDFDFSGLKGSGVSTNFNTPSLFAGVSTASERLDWFGTVRGRLGYLPTNNLLVYGTGGFAYGRVAQSVTYGSLSTITFNDITGKCPALTPVCFAGTSDRIASGWTAGAGLEYAFLNNWTIKIEYLYVNLGSNTFNETVLFTGVSSATSSIAAHYSDFGFNVVRGGVNYKF